MGVQACESKSNKQYNNKEQVLTQCKSTRDKLEKYIQNIEKKEKLSREKAKECLRKKQRDRAKFYLKGCKAYQKQIKIAEGKLSVMEDQIMAIENATTANDTMKALKEGNKALTELHKEVKIEDLENIKDDMEILKENDQEIGNFLKEKADEGIEECEDEYEQLVKEMQTEQNNNKDNISNQNTNLPNIPKNEIISGKMNNPINNVNKQVIVNQ